jgi:hypothetical protein
MSGNNFKTDGRRAASIGALLIITVAGWAVPGHPTVKALKNLLAPKPRLVVLNTIGAAFDQMDFDRVFATAPECHGLTLSRSAVVPDGAIYIAGTVLLDHWSWSVNGFTFEAAPASAARTVCALVNHQGGPLARKTGA